MPGVGSVRGLLSPVPFKLFDRSAGVGAAVSQCFASGFRIDLSSNTWCVYCVYEVF